MQKKIKVLITIVVLVFFGVGGYYIISMFGNHYSSYKVQETAKRQDAESAQYRSYQNGLLKYSRDGISCLDETGEMRWNAAYNMNTPRVVTAGNYVAVADIGKKELYVYDKNGNGTKVDVLLSIMQIALSEQGEVAVLFEDTDAYRVNVYDPYEVGNMLKAEVQTYIEKSGYALDLALSKDGSKLVTSYFDMRNGTLESNITFYLFTKVGENLSVDYFAGATKYEGSIFPEVEFLDNDTVVAFGDQSLELYTFKKTPKAVAEIPLEKKIKKTFFNESYLGVLLTAETGEANRLCLYNKEGKEIWQKELLESYHQIQANKDEIICAGDSGAVIYRVSGAKKFEADFVKSIYGIYPAALKNRYILVTDTDIEEISITK